MVSSSYQSTVQKYLDRKSDEVHKKGYDFLIEELKVKFPDSQWERLHGDPRSQDNESLHSMASKMFSKATRPPGLLIFLGIIACIAGITNWGRGCYLIRVLSSYGPLRNRHLLSLNKIQQLSIYNWHTTRSFELRIRRAVAKKKYKQRQQKRAKNTAAKQAKH